jgi:uncharacterized Ntn-hydrolase superfamily protein
MLSPRAYIAAVALMLSAGQASATYSIVACDRDGNCGVAVATNNLAVGASVPYAQARVGALVSQFETNPSYGPKGLALLASGMAPEPALQRLLDGDGNFDGGSIAERQVGMVAFGGRAATYTGADAQASAWAGVLSGDGYAVQGNGLAGRQVLEQMQRTFAATAGTLAERLMAALEAGENAGGQSSGKMSAALLVRTVEGDWQDIDLRVDASKDPVKDLRGLMERHYALQAIARAERQARKGLKAESQVSLEEARCRSQGWDRILRRAERLASAAGLSLSPTRRDCGK